MRPWLGWHVAWPADASPPRHAAAAPVGAGRRPDRAVRARGTSWRRARCPLADAMTLATVDADGAPGRAHGAAEGRRPGRLSLLHEPTSRPRRRQLEATRRGAALILYWRELDRQVRIRGAVERLPAADVRRVLRDPAARLADRRLGIAAEPAARRSRDRSTRASTRPRRAIRRRGHPPARALGRVPRAARADRVLAGPGRPPARPLRYTRAASRAGGGSSGSRPEPARLAAGGSRVANSSSSSRSSKLQLGADAAAGRAHLDAGAERLLERLLGAGEGRLLVRVGDDLAGPGLVAGRVRAALRLAHRPAARRPRRARGGGDVVALATGSRGRGPR